MPGEKHPIIAHGELYVEPIVKKSRPIDKSIPHEYEDAKQRILSDISNITEKIEIQEEFFLDEKILCVRMEPKFEAKSYVPASITQVSDSISLVGGRKYRFVDNQGDPQSAKLYFMKTTNAGIAALQSALEDGKKDTVKSWRNQIGSIRSIDLLSPDEKVMGFDDEWETGTVEIVLHPLSNENADMIDLFYRVSEIPVGKTQVRQYEDGFTFISAACTYENIENIKRLNFLRAVHPLGQISIAPVRDHPGVEAPTIEPSRQKSSITVGVFDGGSNPSIPLLSGYVNEHNCVSSAAHPELVAHGTGVCGVVLHGNLAGKTKADHLSVPCVSVESFRVLPLQDGSDFELYEAIDAIENTVLARPDIKLYNISFGPKGAIVDDSISRFTYVLDRLTYDVPDDDINPLFSVAVGNDGDLTYPCNRIQAPADMVNGLGVGAYSIARDGRKIRADYSCIGEGREGAKIKPDFLEFGGSLDRPFIIAGTTPNTLSASAGTSFSSPLAVNKIGRLMAKSESITPHIGRTLLIHNGILQVIILLAEEVGGVGHAVVFLVVFLSLLCRVRPQLVHAGVGVVQLLLSGLQLELCLGKSNAVFSLFHQNCVVLLCKLIFILLICLSLCVLLPRLGISTQCSGTTLNRSVLDINQIREFRHQLTQQCQRIPVLLLFLVGEAGVVSHLLQLGNVLIRNLSRCRSLSGG